MVEPWVRVVFNAAAADFVELLEKARPYSDDLKLVRVLSHERIDADFANVTILAPPRLIDLWATASPDVKMEHMAEHMIFKEAVTVCEERGFLKPNME